MFHSIGGSSNPLLEWWVSNTGMQDLIYANLDTQSRYYFTALHNNTFQFWALKFDSRLLDRQDDVSVP